MPTGWELIIDIRDGTSTAGWLTKTLGAFGVEYADIRDFVDNLIGSRQPSVDAFIESRPEYLVIGKLAIAACLIRKENTKFLERTNDSEDWYSYLMNRIGSVETDFLQPNVDIVTLNYDRSLEYFFHGAFKSRFGLDDSDALVMVKKLGIRHVYGILGEPDFTNAEKTRPYSSSLATEYIEIARDGIEIMEEYSMHDNQLDSMNAARKLIASADVVCFLGFGYLASNLSRLLDDVQTKAELFGLAKGTGNDVREETNVYFKKQFGRYITFGEDGDTSLPFLKKLRVLI